MRKPFVIEKAALFYPLLMALVLNSCSDKSISGADDELVKSETDVRVDVSFERQSNGVLSTNDTSLVLFLRTSASYNSPNAVPFKAESTTVVVNGSLVNKNFSTYSSVLLPKEIVSTFHDGDPITISLSNPYWQKKEFKATCVIPFPVTSVSVDGGIDTVNVNTRSKFQLSWDSQEGCRYLITFRAGHTVQEAQKAQPFTAWPTPQSATSSFVNSEYSDSLLVDSTGRAYEYFSIVIRAYRFVYYPGFALGSKLTVYSDPVELTNIP